VLYLFSGVPRPQTVKFFLKKLAKECNVEFEMQELDIITHKKIYFSKQKVREEWLAKIDQGLYDLLVDSPPCSTFTKAVWANSLGPPPIRSFEHPRGFTWLKFAARQKAHLGNVVADFSFEALRRQLQHPWGMIIKEQPEDLGAVRGGKHAGCRPASMWQWDEMKEIAKLPGVQTAGLHQSDFGTEYPKPTRLLFKFGGDEVVDGRLYPGPPTFDKQGFYTGPIPRSTPKATSNLLRRPGDSNFRTAVTAAWPPQFCSWIADQAMAGFLDNVKKGVYGQQLPGGSDVNEQAADFQPVQTPTEVDNKTMVNSITPSTLLPPPVPGGRGPPRACRAPGKTLPYHDGAGLASPGRWDLEHRFFPESADWGKLRRVMEDLAMKSCGEAGGIDRLCFKMAVSKAAPFSEVDPQKGREALAEWLKDGQEDVGLLEVSPGQPFYLRLLAASL
jgi:hypothetical protein